MILVAFIARVSDGMLLVASMDTRSEKEETMDVYKSQARQVLKSVTPDSPAKCSIESGPLDLSVLTFSPGPFIFHYLISEGVCYLCLTRKTYPKQLAFKYLDEVAEAFIQELGHDWKTAVETAARPYAFIKFDKTLQRKRRDFSDPTDRQNQAKIDDDIADITSIMKRNIDEVLNRGEKLDRLVETTSNLKNEAHKYKWGAKKFSALVFWRQYAPVFAILALILFVLYLKFRL